MPSHRESHNLPHSAAQMYTLVADVARYGDFLPWVAGVRIKSDSDKEMIADLIVGFKGLREQFTSRVIKTENQAIDIDYLDGPLKYLHNEWRFRDRAEGGSIVEFYIDFSFKSKMFERLAGQMFGKALQKMTRAFIERADDIYGVSSLTPPGNNSSNASTVA